MLKRINEDYLSHDDIEDVLNNAARQGLPGTGFAGMFKKKISVADLRQAWADAGYPEDSTSVSNILKGLGYDRMAVNKVFRDTFDTRHGRLDTGNSPAVVELAKTIVKSGYKDEILTFLEHQYNFVDTGTPIPEHIRTIFERIIHEERAGLPVLQKQFEQKNLGRHRK